MHTYIHTHIHNYTHAHTHPHTHTSHSSILWHYTHTHTHTHTIATHPSYGTPSRSRSLASHNFCLQTVPICSVRFQLRHRASLTASSFRISIQGTSILFLANYKANFIYKFSYGRHNRQVKASSLVPFAKYTLLKKDKMYPITGLDRPLKLQ